ncbi:MAG TPA: glycerol-3-phosphate 1-O-acyltransferase PlsY [Bacillales bacterium]|nr:glycerol-3-phosphate 1-O-acyltransferase PlsY [Bacillales bacterium]
MTLIISIVLAYLLGAISFSYLITKLLLRDDIRKHGSGNAGATNTLRVLGVFPAVLVLLLDVFKGVLAIWIAGWIGGGELAAAAAGLMAIVGHNWPIYYGFRGGKGVATTIGVFATLFLFPALSVGAFAIFLIVITRFVSLGSLCFVVLAPICALFFGDVPAVYAYVGLIIAMLSIWRHRSNIQRLLNGTENKIGKKGS